MRSLRSLAGLCTLAAAAGAQGNFVNFELPVVKGLAVAQTAQATFVIAANPDDNSIVLVNTATDAASRVAVGMGPVSVFYDASNGRIYTANFLGDSVSMLELLPTQSPPARLLATQPIGDEPTDVSVRPGTNELFVLLGSRSEVARLDKATLAGIGYVGSDNLLPVVNPTATKVMKYPYRLIHRPSGNVLILNQRAGSNPASNVLAANADFDLLEWDHGLVLVGLEGSVQPNNPLTGTLGTTNMGMALAQDGRLFVIGNKARNDIVGEPSLSTATTGFVESRLWIVPPIIKASADDRDLNLDSNGTLRAPAARVSMPTDVALDEVGTTLQRVFVTSFGTDRLVTLTPNAGAVKTWVESSTQLGPPRPGYAMAGPRSLALATASGQRRLYVLCRLDASVRRFDVGATGALSNEVRIDLQDPMGTATRAGQRFLYDARESGGGMVSCASCHIDGRTDGLAWKLDPPGSASPGNVSAALRDGIATVPAAQAAPFPGDRGPMITQTMQGLALGLAQTTNAIPDWLPSTDAMLSTEPFYWRGRRANFAAFAGAFVNLMGRAVALTPTEIAAFRDHAFTILYPPNPEQGIERVYDGGLGPVVSGTNTRTLASGSGALRGLKLFHNMPLQTTGPFAVLQGNLTAGRSCVECHRLPSGTNGLITVRESDLQPLKTIQLRGLRARERLFRPYRTFPSAATAYPPNPPTLSSLYTDLLATPHGLLHTGGFESLDQFEAVNFSPIEDLSGVSPAVMADLTKFLRQFDTGTAPIVGVPLSVTASTHGQWAGTLQVIVALAQAQAERANSGLAVLRRVNSVTNALFYDVTRLPGAYVDPANPGSATVWPLNGTGGVVPDFATQPLTGNDLIVFQSVPPGSERRIASLAGVLPVQSITSAPAITDVGLVVPDPWQPILQLGQNLPLLPGATPVPHVFDLPGTFLWQGLDASPKSLAAQVNFFQTLQGQFGVPATAGYRHEAPRRFRVRGDNIFHGATLRVGLPTAWSGTTPTAFGSTVTFALHPARVNGDLVWETATAIPPDVVYAMLCGWMAAPGVLNTWRTGQPAPQALSALHNSFQLQVTNEHPTAPLSSTVVRALTLQ